MKHLSDLGLEDSGERQRRLAVNFALIFTFVRLTYILGLPTSSHSQATSISTSSCLNLLEKLGLEIPLGLPADVWGSLIPKDNFLTAEKVSLGEKLYFDKRLFTDRTASTATNCHSDKLIDNTNGIACVRRRPNAANTLKLISSFRYNWARSSAPRLDQLAYRTTGEGQEARPGRSDDARARSAYSVSAQGRADEIRRTLKILSG